MKEEDVKKLQQDFENKQYMFLQYIDKYNLIQQQKNGLNIFETILDKLEGLTLAMINVEKRLKYHEDRQENLIKEMAGITPDSY